MPDAENKTPMICKLILVIFQRCTFTRKNVGLFNDESKKTIYPFIRLTHVLEGTDRLHKDI